MTDERQLRYTDGTLTHEASCKSISCASLAGVANGGPLFGILGFSFLASGTLLLICLPLLLIFSPLLFGAIFAFVGALTRFTAPVDMGVAGFHSLAWIYMQVRGYLGFRGYERVKEPWQEDLGGYLQQRARENSSQSDEHNNETRLITVE